MIKLLSKYMKDIDWKIFLSMNDDETFNVTLVPVPKVKDQALKEMAPVILKNYSLEELDAVEDEVLDAAFTKVQSLVSNVAQFEKNTEEQGKLTKMVKEKREANKKKKEKAERQAKEASPLIFDDTSESEASENIKKEVTLNL